MSVDLKDAYFNVPVTPRHRKFLFYAFQAIAQTRVPFGYYQAPLTFAKCVEAAIELLGC